MITHLEAAMADPCGDDADIDLDTQELVKPTSEEQPGYGPGEWASGPLPVNPSSAQLRTEGGDADIEHRIRDAEAAVEGLRATVTDLEREVAVVRADLERLRQERLRATAPKVP